MKKTFYYFLLLVLPLAVVSCSDDDDDIVGKWSLTDGVAEDVRTNIAEATEEIKKDMNFTVDPEEEYDVFIFREDKTFTNVSGEYNNGKWVEDITDGTYTFSDNKVTITVNGMSVVMEVRVSKNQLSLIHNDPEEYQSNYDETYPGLQVSVAKLKMNFKRQ